ncbi:phosphoesterase RecJ domain-containing protein [Abditibacterium utsteinense]|uniref:Phosphoesterase RecJ domain-containing protein n=1 Tax=Abditibacterium utsteinense TaxID=1960156 RepID=A0A2S8STB7_9BACT|nr:DHH family phosphoesterase [Abditibacterium utsteinense]PQV64040.1 phosphoesterase RecJ domain-containing protein [Abditibacterium utsteinense]
MIAPPFEAIAAAIERNQKFYITTHIGPDGDAVGPALALKIALEMKGKTAIYVSRDGVPPSARFLPRCDEVASLAPEGFRPDCAFILDCDGTPERVSSNYEPIAAAPFKILIDHHRTSKPIFDVNWLDPNQPATAMMIYELLIALKLEITPAMAAGILCGISCDTGHFRFSNTTPAVLKAAGHLVELGADVAQTAFKIFDERSFSSTQLMGLALTNMHSASSGQLVYAALSASDFASIGTGDDSSENVVNFLRNIKGARMALIFRERRDDVGTVTRISVRASPELRADLFADEFGGGGHAAAAGCKQRGNFEQAVQRVTERAVEWLEEEHEPVSE